MRFILAIAVSLLLISCQSARESDTTRLEKNREAAAELNRINSLLTSNRPVTRIELDSLTKLQSEYPGSPEVRRVLQGALIKRADWPAAEKIILATPEDERTNADRLNLAKILFKQGKFDDAVGVLKAMSPDAGERVEVASLLGQSQFYSGELEQAMKSLEAVRTDLAAQRRGDDLAHLGMIYHRRGENQKALAALQQAIEVSPENITAHSALVRVHAALGDTVQAETLGATLRSLNDKVAAAEQKKSRLVPLYYELEDAYSAKDFARVIALVGQIQPDADETTKAALYQYLAAAYRAQGREAEAQKALENAARLTQK